MSVKVNKHTTPRKGLSGNFFLAFPQGVQDTPRECDNTTQPWQCCYDAAADGNAMKRPDFLAAPLTFPNPWQTY